MRSRPELWLTLVLLSGLTLNLPAQDEPAPPAGSEEEAPPGEAPQPTAAERIADLRKAVETDTQQLEALQAAVEDPESEYVKAEQAFREMDDGLDQLTDRIQKLRAQGSAFEAEALVPELEVLRKKRENARERFDLAIEARNHSLASIESLKQKIAADRAELARLERLPPGEGDTRPPDGTPPPPENDKPPEPVSPPPEGNGTGEGNTPAGEGAPESQPERPVTPLSADQEKAIQEAREEARRQRAAAEDALQQSQTLQDRVQALQKLIELLRGDLETYRKRADNAYQDQKLLTEEIRRKRREGASAGTIAELDARLDEARTRFQEARGKVGETTDRLEEYGTQLSRAQEEALRAQRQAEEAAEEADRAESKVRTLENPWSPLNLLQWLIYHGPRLLVILIVVYLALWGTRVISRRMQVRVLQTSTEHKEEDTLEEQTRRAETLAAVFQSSARFFIYVTGTIVFLDEVGLPIGPILGGAAVVGLAVAFGAQTLIRDAFYGFFILLENQYTVNDVIQVGDTSGLVEKLTLRMTVLRDLEGNLHFIPNGNITKVSNMTHTWSRALWEVAFDRSASVEDTTQLLLDLTRELRTDPTLGRDITDDPVMLGITEVVGPMVKVKFMVRTRPLQQWGVKRELNRRILAAFAERGIGLRYVR